jgi:hypothetical protein
LLSAFALHGPSFNFNKTYYKTSEGNYAVSEENDEELISGCGSQ